MADHRIPIACAALAVLAVSGCAQNDPFKISGESSMLAATSLTPYDRGKRYFKAGQYGLAIEAFQSAIARNGEDDATLNGLAAAYDMIGRGDLAERYYRIALARDPNSINTLNNLGYSYLLRGDRTAAKKYLARAAKLDGAPPTVSANLKLAEQPGVTKKPEPVKTMAKVMPRPEPTQVPITIKTTWIEQVSPNMQALVTRIDPGLRAKLLRANTAPELAVPATVGGGNDARANAYFGPYLEQGNGIVTLHTRPYALPAKQFVAIQMRDLTKAAKPSPKTEQKVALANPAEAQRAVVEKLAAPIVGSIEVANGAGRRFMAARMRQYLSTKGIGVSRLSNAESFANRTTVVFYRKGYRDAAVAVSETLPVKVRLREVAKQPTAIRLRLGGDLLKFDKSLIEKNKITTRS